MKNTYKSSFLSLVRCGNGSFRKIWNPIGTLKSNKAPNILNLIEFFPASNVVKISQFFDCLKKYHSL